MQLILTYSLVTKQPEKLNFEYISPWEYSAVETGSQALEVAWKELAFCEVRLLSLVASAVSIKLPSAVVTRRNQSLNRFCHSLTANRIAMVIGRQLLERQIPCFFLLAAKRVISFSLLWLSEKGPTTPYKPA